MRVGMCKANYEFKDVYVKGLEEPELFKIPETFLENSFPQPEHMWIMKNGEVMEVSGN
jgi:hypothetical protein